MEEPNNEQRKQRNIFSLSMPKHNRGNKQEELDVLMQGGQYDFVGIAENGQDEIYKWHSNIWEHSLFFLKGRGEKETL